MARCKTTHFACDCMLERMAKLESDLEEAKEVLELLYDYEYGTLKEWTAKHPDLPVVSDSKMLVYRTIRKRLRAFVEKPQEVSDA